MSSLYHFFLNFSLIFHIILNINFIRQLKFNRFWVFEHQFLIIQLNLRYLSFIECIFLVKNLFNLIGFVKRLGLWNFFLLFFKLFVFTENIWLVRWNLTVRLCNYTKVKNLLDVFRGTLRQWAALASILFVCKLHFILYQIFKLYKVCL